MALRKRGEEREVRGVRTFKLKLIVNNFAARAKVLLLSECHSPWEAH